MEVDHDVFPGSCLFLLGCHGELVRGVTLDDQHIDGIFKHYWLVLERIVQLEETHNQSVNVLLDLSFFILGHPITTWWIDSV